MGLIFERSKTGRRGVRTPVKDVPASLKLPSKFTRAKDAALPEISEPEVVRHFTNLSKLNF